MMKNYIKKTPSKLSSQPKSTNQTHDLGHKIEMTPWIEKQKQIFEKKMLLKKIKIDSDLFFKFMIQVMISEWPR
jgi:hypothetical protein